MNQQKEIAKFLKNKELYFDDIAVFDRIFYDLLIKIICTKILNPEYIFVTISIKSGHYYHNGLVFPLYCMKPGTLQSCISTLIEWKYRPYFYVRIGLLHDNKRQIADDFAILKAVKKYKKMEQDLPKNIILWSGMIY